MASLIDSITAIEEQANNLISKAHAEAKETEKSTENEIRVIQEEMAATVQSRAAAYRQEAEGRHRAAVAKAETEAQAALAAVDSIKPEVIREQARCIVARFCER